MHKLEYLFITSKTKLELLREQAESATEWKEKTDLALQQKSSECVNLQNEINGLSDKVDEMQEQIDASRTTESQLLSKLDDLTKQLEDSRALTSSLEGNIQSLVSIKAIIRGIMAIIDFNYFCLLL